MKKYYLIAIFTLIAHAVIAAETSREYKNNTEINNMEKKDNYKTAIFAGGCFWGVEHYMQKQAGVISVVSGYIGGHVENPTYEDVKTRESGHAEAVRITYNPEKTDYETLLRFFFEIHDPTQLDKQGVDVGPQYRSEIFYQTAEEKAITEKLIKILKERGYKVVTKVTPATKFYDAEDYHQDYFENHPSAHGCHFYTKRF